MFDSGDPNPFVIIHRATTATEAMVIRSLLESSGIEAPDFTAGKPLSAHAHPAGIAGEDIAVPASQADDGRRIITEYLSSNEERGGNV
jgi:hypothetical protein